MPRDGDRSTLSNRSSPTPLFLTDQNNPLAVAMQAAQRCASIYDGYGGDHTKYYVGITSNNPTGFPQNPQEEVEFADARIVATNMLLDLTNANAKLAPFNLVINPDLDYAQVKAGLEAGGSFEDAQKFLYAIGYGTWRLRANLMMRFYVDYNSAMCGNGLDLPSFMNDWPGAVAYYQQMFSEYINVKTGVVSTSMPTGVPLVTLGINTRLWVPVDKASAEKITTQIVALRPTPNTPPVDWVDQVVIRVNPPPGYPSSPNSAEDGAHIGSAYASLAYRLTNTASRDTAITELLMTQSELSRWQAVEFEGAALAQKCIAASKASKIVYGLRHLIAKMPLSPYDVVALQAADNPVMFPEFPYREAVFFLICYWGVNPLITVASGGLAVSTKDFYGSPMTSSIGLDPNALTLWEQVWRALICIFAAENGWKYINFSVDPDGEVTEWGSTIQQPQITNPDGTTSQAFPWFKDNTQWADLGAALANKLCTQAQLARVFDLGFAHDPSMAIPLALIPGQPGGNNTIGTPDPDFAAAFYAVKNHQVLRDAWLAAPVPQPQPAPPSGSVTPIPFGPLQPPFPSEANVPPPGGLPPGIASPVNDSVLRVLWTRKG